MKSFFKVLGIVVVLAAMLFNLHISRLGDKGHVTLAYVRNVAQAQTEGDAVYLYSQERTGTSTVDHINTDGSECTETFNFDITVCVGQGTVSCTPKSLPPTNVQWYGDCPFH